MAQITEQNLFDLKDKIDEAKTKVSELTGQKQALMKQLKDEWNCTTLQQAETKLIEMRKQVNNLELQIEKGVEDLEQEYNFNQEV